MAPLLNECLEIMNTNKIVDLCSGAGGPILKIQKDLCKSYAKATEVSLTDLYPNNESCQYNKSGAHGIIKCVDNPVDATAVPVALDGIRTLFSSIHHFGPDEVRKILEDAAKSKQGIAIFDIGEKNLISVVGILIFHPVLQILLTPFFRPFRFKTILFTYFIPLILIFTIWDGVMSILRLYSPNDLQNLAEEIKTEKFQWRSGKVKNRLGLDVTYLIGIPSA